MTIPRVITNRLFEFDGDTYEIMTMDYESNIARLRNVSTDEIIQVRIDGVAMKIEGEMV